MAQPAVMPLRLATVAVALAGALLLAAAADPAVAVTAKTVGPQDLTRSIANPLERLIGLWRVVSVEGHPPATALVGRRLRIDRDSAASLAHGTCTNPHFAESLGSFTISCLGQPLGVAVWDPQRPGTIRWSEGDVEAVLRRVSGTEALPNGQ
jgi:hypothetical protein